MPLSWKAIWEDFALAYSAKPDAERQPVEAENQWSPKFIVILVITVFFALVIVCLLIAILYKCLSKRRQGKKEKISSPKKQQRTPDSPQDKPRHTKLMRSDSSLSEVDASRDSSLPPTPLSPLSEEDSLPFPFERGRLEFSMFFDREHESLRATVIQAHGLPQRSCVFYVEGTLLPDITTRQQTSLRYHNPSPVFEETIKFTLPFEELSERTLCLKVVELDGFSQKLPVGRLLYSFDIENNNYMDIMKMDVDLAPELPQDEMENSNCGELLVSLCYLPTAGRLTLVILKCRLFHANKGLPSPFLKVSLMLNKKQVKKIKTSVKTKTLTPVYNEAFIFDVPAQHIGNVGLYARVVNQRDNQELLGKVIIGPHARTSMGIHHWECMLLSPRKPIAQWHKISS